MKDGKIADLVEIYCFYMILGDFEEKKMVYLGKNLGI